MRRGIIFLIAVFILVYGQGSFAAEVSKGLFIKYVPPKMGKPGARIGGGSRGGGTDDVKVEALVPDHTGFTSQPQPALCWYASKPITARVEITIGDDSSAAPLFEKQIAATEKSGLQCVQLREQGITLKPGVEYQWFVALVPDPSKRSKDLVSGGIISFLEASKDFHNKVSASTGLERAAAFAEAGYWYDAIGVFAELIQANPNEKNLIEQINSVLKQVGLSGVQ